MKPVDHRRLILKRAEAISMHAINNFKEVVEIFLDEEALEALRAEVVATVADMVAAVEVEIVEAMVIREVAEVMAVMAVVEVMVVAVAVAVAFLAENPQVNKFLAKLKVY